jgi:hypothetical protein
LSAAAAAATAIVRPRLSFTFRSHHQRLTGTLGYVHRCNRDEVEEQVVQAMRRVYALGPLLHKLYINLDVKSFEDDDDDYGDDDAVPGDAAPGDALPGDDDGEDDDDEAGDNDDGGDDNGDDGDGDDGDGDDDDDDDD